MARISNERVQDVTISTETVRGQCVFTAWVPDMTQGRRLIAPARPSKSMAKADGPLLLKLAGLGESGVDIIAKWRRGQCNDREAARLAKPVLKKPSCQIWGLTGQQRRNASSLFNVSDVVLKRPAFDTPDIGSSIGIQGPLKRLRLRGKQPPPRCFLSSSEGRGEKYTESKNSNISPAVEAMQIPEMVAIVAPTEMVASSVSQGSVSIGSPTLRSEASVAGNGNINAVVESVIASQPTGTSDSPSSSSDSSSSDPAAEADSSQPVAYDEQIFARIRDALLARESEISAESREALARDIAREFAKQLQNPRPQLRTFLFNLRDPKNSDFFKEVVTKSIPPKQIPHLPSEVMASSEKRAERTSLQEKYTRESTLQRGASGSVDVAALSNWRALKARR